MCAYPLKGYFRSNKENYADRKTPSLCWTGEKFCLHIAMGIAELRKRSLPAHPKACTTSILPVCIHFLFHKQCMWKYSDIPGGNPVQSGSGLPCTAWQRGRGLPRFAQLGKGATSSAVSLCLSSVGSKYICS